MEDDGLAIPGDLQVAFDGIAAGDRRSEGRGRVLDDALAAVMQATVGNGARREKACGAGMSSLDMVTRSR